MPAAIRAEKLNKVFGDTRAVIDVSFEVQTGEVFVVMGLSGSGKSTLLRMLNGLLTPTSGTVYVDGVLINSVSDGFVHL